MKFPNTENSYEIVRPGGEQITNPQLKATLKLFIILIARNATGAGPIREVTTASMSALLKGIEYQLLENGITHDPRVTSAYTVKVYFQALANARENPAGYYLLKFKVKNK